ncbi:MAG: hypothetical protein GQ570_11845 [Helicobacteraceae bacterium]|nr:hypothetical protein [Helicobacteraceae bacterium]
MAIPSYTTDLTTIATGDLVNDAGTWDESTDAGWDDAGSMVDDQNLYYNNTECVSAQYTKTGVGTIMYVHTSAFTIPTDGAVLLHHLWAAPPALNPIATGGVRILVGTDFGNFDGWNASGSDFAPAPRGGWANYAINPAIGTPDYVVGTTTTIEMIGIGVAALAQARGNPNAVNAIRYGRCESIFTDGQAANYATFSGYAAIDDLTTNRWNLIEPVEGGYKFQGLMSLGTAGTLVDFRDSNSNITIRNTINVTSAFNAIEVNNASSNIEWTAIGITSLGTISKGTFNAVDNATILKTSCTFTDMDTFIYKSSTTLSTCIFRRCGLVTQDSATITSCTFDNPTGTVGLLVNSLNSVTKCTFNSDGTGHGVDLGTISADISLNWDNFESGYTDASSGNETIVVSVDSGITLTINVQSGASTPFVYNIGLGSVSVVSGQVTTLITVKDIVTGSILEGAMVYLVGSGGLLDGVEIFREVTDINGQVSDTRSVSADQLVTGRVRFNTAPNHYKTVPINETISSTNGLTLNAQMIKDI